MYYNIITDVGQLSLGGDCQYRPADRWVYCRLPYTVYIIIYYYIIYTCTSVYLHFKCKSQNPTSVLMDEQQSKKGGVRYPSTTTLRLLRRWRLYAITAAGIAFHSNRSTFHKKKFFRRSYTYKYASCMYTLIRKPMAIIYLLLIFVH